MKIISFFKKIKLILKDSKKKALFQLGLYALFFIFVFILIGLGEPTTQKPNKEDQLPIKEQNKSEINNYEYTIIDYINNKTITGSYNSDEYNFIYDKSNYIYKDGTTYLDDEIISEVIDIENYSYDKIIELINYSESETTYKNDKKVTYSVNISDYLNNNSISNIYEINDGIINLTIEKESYINHVEIIENDIKLYDIYYSDINSI